MASGPKPVPVSEGPALAGLREVDLETEVLRASDRLEACAEEYGRRGRPYPAMRLIYLVRQAQELIAGETAWRKEHRLNP